MHTTTLTSAADAADAAAADATGATDTDTDATGAAATHPAAAAAAAADATDAAAPAAAGTAGHRRRAWSALRSAEGRRLTSIGAAGLAYFLALTIALHLQWYPHSLPGYVYLGVAAVLGAAACQRWPLETLTNVTAFTAYMSLGPLPLPLYGIYVRPPESLVPLAIVTFLVISNRGPVVAPAATFGTLSVLVILPWRDIADALRNGRPLTDALLLDSGTDRSILAGELVACALVVLVAVMLRRQRRAARQLAEKNRELRQLRGAEVAHIAERERARIARDLHDEVAHHVAALVIRAQSAIRVADRHPEQLAPAMRDVVEGGQDVLTRMRAVVRILRTTPASVPVPGPLAHELDALFDRVRSVGYEVDGRVDVHAEVPSPHRAAIVGIVQESLTNTMLHSSARSVRVVVEERPLVWSVTVSDPGPQHERFPGVPGGGTGIPSMQDRASLVGGRVRTGADADGAGWSVRAELPRPSLTMREERP